MLTPYEFSAGAIIFARPISLVRPLVEHDPEFLIAGSVEAPVAVFLSGESIYQHLEAADGDSWAGLIIPDLRVELDDASAFDARAERDALGALVRMGAELAICVKRERGNGTEFVRLLAGLPVIGEHRVGFRRWQLVLGEGCDKRVIRTFEEGQ
ncbi:hypothetical protein LU699_13045 [Luteimonas fraxinea]|uniref:Uncharacterized protein n=1 Tax=Luteimonas fraxinea TaxID=2901869 RepID=A0ABS8UGN8_9GAMM|nr:hypothetical protein [Luteimonas fraxinea]MCD9098060.1 hypothetical protein [Luteimonas fraxinea]UHH09215.1 hypothetical protein LU699_13045 [Luteimonas fraxinea]